MPPTSNKNAMWKYRKRLKLKETPEEHALYLQREKERYKQRKAAGKIETIKDMSNRDQRLLRKKMVHGKEKAKGLFYAKEKEDEIRSVHTPPPSPSGSIGEAPPSCQKLQERKKLRRE